jgi:hypothetical protein
MQLARKLVDQWKSFITDLQTKRSAIVPQRVMHQLDQMYH